MWPSQIVAITVDSARSRAVHRIHPIDPVQAVLLAGSFTLFLAAALCDYAYWSSYQVQWSDFASWMITGALVFGGAALVLALVSLRHGTRRSGSPLLYGLMLLLSWVVGFINALVHAKDVWAVMPEGLVLSIVAVVLAAVATWIGFSNLRTGDLS